MSAGKNYRYPERSGVFFTTSADLRHALRVIASVCEADLEEHFLRVQNLKEREGEKSVS